MLNNIFLTGPVGVGKSTILYNALKELDVSLGGYITQRVYQKDYMKFIVKSLYDMEQHTIIEIDTNRNLKRVFTEVFENGLIHILDKSIDHSDLIVLDELGIAENDIEIFTTKVFQLLDSKKIVFGVLKDSDCEFLNQIRNRDDVIIIRITEENRDHILEEILGILRDLFLS